MNKNIPFYIFAVGVFVIMKFWFRTFGNDQLLFLLYPTNSIIELITGDQAIYTSGSGFEHPRLNIIIEKSCSGYNFLLLCFLVLYFQSLKHSESLSEKAFQLVQYLAIAYISTIFINASRIIISIILKHSAIDNFRISRHIIHESIGVVTYLTFLLFVSVINEKLLNTKYAKLK
ncbi:exosortase K [Halosquirtibacter xylanolyticus]|uniref:exosortase K n=1 Tax=Halosquirtibacter xylanolyticus TaxID=3374599 RepID=UPI00374A7A28|nr:exosortase K [Prolixibacteraceae bacterium]